MRTCVGHDPPAAQPPLHPTLQERKRCEEAQREAEGQAGRAADAGRRADRLEGEALELEAVVAQKQELIGALQVGGSRLLARLRWSNSCAGPCLAGCRPEALACPSCPPPTRQAENDATNTKLMAHREVHQQEVEALRRQLRDEGQGQVGRRGGGRAVGAAQCRACVCALAGCLGATCASLPPHQVAVLQQRCCQQAAELRTVQREHEQALAQLAQQHGQQVAQLEAQRAAAEACSSELRCLAATLGEGRQEDLEAEARRSRLSCGVQALLDALEAAAPGLTAADACAALLGAGDLSGATAAARQLGCTLRQHVEAAEAAAVHLALSTLEEELLPSAAISPGATPTSPRRLLASPAKQRLAAAAPSMEEAEGRLAALLARSRELLGRLGASEAGAAQLQQQVAALEAAAARSADTFAAVGAWFGAGCIAWGRAEMLRGQHKVPAPPPPRSPCRHPRPAGQGAGAGRGRGGAGRRRGAAAG